MEQLNNIENPIDITTRYFCDFVETKISLTREQERDFVERARTGDVEAREMIILSSLAYVIKVATSYFKTLATHHDEFLDLVSIGNCELVKMVDVALTKQNPLSYLYMCARYAIRRHCYYRSDLIIRPDAGGERKKVESLDVLYGDEQFDVPAVEDVSSDEEDINYEALHEALTCLSERQREVVIRHYGLFGQPEERLPDIDRIYVSAGLHREALIKLRKKLANMM